MPSDHTPTCPACGYLRRGIDAAARCPECGADGLDGAVVLVGTTRSARSTLIAIGSFGSFGAMSIVILVSSSAALLLMLLVAFGTVVTIALGLGGFRRWDWAPLRPATVVWTVHPSGVEIRCGRSRVSVPREELRRISCSDSLIGEMSQLQLVRRKSSLRLAGTPLLYLHGTKDDRRARWRAACQTLQLPIPS